MAQKTDIELQAQRQIIENETGNKANTATRIGDMFEDIIDSKANNSTLPTREFNRAFSSELLFDKNEIEGELNVQTDDITFTVAESGNLADQWSVYGQRITTDGVHGIFFEGFAHVSNITNGEVLEAGTYQFIFWFSNGIARASLMLPSQESFNLPTLATPTNFVAVPGAGDPETEVDITSDAVVNATSYELDFSTAGGSGPWTNIPSATGTSFTHTGRTPGTTYYYRKRAVASGFNSSQYAIATATTEDSGDLTAPTFVFAPADAATDVAVNQVITITASEPIQDADGVTEITDANITDYLVVKEDDGAGADIPYTATIDVAKTIITITPNVVWPTNGDVFVQIDGIEDLNGNEPSADSATFSVGDFTVGSGNNLSFGSQVDSVIAAADGDWEVEFEFEDMVRTGLLRMTAKHDSADLQVSHVLRTNTDVNDNVSFKFYRRESAVGFSAREVIWHNALSGVTSGKLTLKYDDAIDTNNGIDRAKLFIDDVEITSGKSLVTTNGSTSWPWSISGGTAPFVFAMPTFRRVRNFKLRTNDGATTVIDVPIIRTGQDVSGNNFDGTWE